MAKRINSSRIKKNLTYSIVETAEELNVSIATIRNWIKRGLPIEKSQRPFLIYGCDLREFIVQMQNARKFTLKDDELICFTCKSGRQALHDDVFYIPQTSKTGRLKGVCCICGGKCARIISNAKIGDFSRVFRIQFNNDQPP